MYIFQSLDRNLDLAGKAIFKNYQFITDNEEVADFVRRNCKAQPHNIWELSAEEAKAEQVDTPDKPKRGRPKNAVHRGMRTATLAEGVSV